MKAILGAFFGTTMIGASITHFIVVCGSAAAVFTGLLALAVRIYDFSVENLEGFLGYVSEEDTSIIDFVSYVLNFDFIRSFMLFYYMIFVTIAISFITLSIAEFCAHVYPLVVQTLRSQINFISGDS